MDAYKEVKQAATARKAQNATVSNATDEEVAEANVYFPIRCRFNSCLCLNGIDFI
jgi:hypothetical protein